ncbi:zeta toxin family protein [Heyndrickxia oleronia]|jgi:predicted ABC-type ATPase|uniref:zeta toxin family protein n=1 Tax=Heyndrickxia oleronia TaxID=38875 RepID=UPI00242ED87B|nr:zeta toxin family protein [Heyndrickxia oleronia]MCI1763625.1 zeta toxin family protein [Heyndrickxia oleronia]
METTKSIYQSDGEYYAERQLLHEDIINEFLHGDQIDIESPDSFLLGGGSAAGKSTIGSYFLAQYREETGHMTLIDADVIKEHLPEFRQMANENPLEAADYVHEESSDIASKLLMRCIAEKRSFMYDGTMKNLDKYKEIIEALKQRGYKVSAIVVDVPLDVAKERAKIRLEADGRFVPESVIVESHSKVASTFREIKDLLDEYMVYDNSIQPFELIASKDMNIGETIANTEKLRRFFQKAGIEI